MIPRFHFPLLISVALCMAFVSPVTVVAQETPLEQARREYGYELIRAYIEYAKENPDVVIPVFKFSDYFVRKFDDKLMTSNYVVSDTVAPKMELMAAWRIYTEHLGQLNKYLLDDPEFQQLARDAKQKLISRSDFSEQRSVINQRIYKQFPETVELYRKYAAAQALAGRNCMQIILDDYIRQEKGIATDWIPKSLVPKLEKSKNLRPVIRRLEGLNGKP